MLLLPNSLRLTRNSRLLASISHPPHPTHCPVVIISSTHRPYASWIGYLGRPLTKRLCAAPVPLRCNKNSREMYVIPDAPFFFCTYYLLWDGWLALLHQSDHHDDTSGLACLAFALHEGLLYLARHKAASLRRGSCVSDQS